MPTENDLMPRTIINGKDERPDLPPDEDADLGAAASAIEDMLEVGDESEDELVDEEDAGEPESEIEEEEEEDEAPPSKKKGVDAPAKSRAAAPDPATISDDEYLASADASLVDEDEREQENNAAKGDKKKDEDDFSVIEPKLLAKITTEYEGELADGFKQLAENASKHIKAIKARSEEALAPIRQELARYQRREVLEKINEIRQFAEQTFKNYPKAQAALGGMNPSKASAAQAKAMRTLIAQAVAIQRHAENHPENPRAISLSKALDHVFRRDYAKIVSEADAQRKAAEKPTGGRNVRFVSGKHARTTRTDRNGDDDGTRSAVNEIAQKFGLPVR